MRAILTLALLVSLSFSVWAKPERNTPAKPAPKKEESLPDLRMQSNWGEITQNGDSITITGHPSWSAIGRILKGGKVALSWEWLSDGSRAPGFYSWDGVELKGVWNYQGVVIVEDDGSLRGPTLLDRIYKVSPPAEIQ
jgi:hypothetical protein